MNPCEECIVDVMCKDPCKNLDVFLHDLINSKCNLDIERKDNIGKSIRYSHTGLMVLQDRNDYGVHIKYKGGKICSIIVYPPIYSKETGRRMSLYDPLKGETLYETKSM